MTNTDRGGDGTDGEVRIGSGEMPTPGELRRARDDDAIGLEWHQRALADIEVQIANLSTAAATARLQIDQVEAGRALREEATAAAVRREYDSAVRSGSELNVHRAVSKAVRRLPVARLKLTGGAGYAKYAGAVEAAGHQIGNLMHSGGAVIAFEGGVPCAFTVCGAPILNESLDRVTIFLRSPAGREQGVTIDLTDLVRPTEDGYRSTHRLYGESDMPDALRADLARPDCPRAAWVVALAGLNRRHALEEMLHYTDADSVDGYLRRQFSQLGIETNEPIGTIIDALFIREQSFESESPARTESIVATLRHELVKAVAAQLVAGTADVDAIQQRVAARIGHIMSRLNRTDLTVDAIMQDVAGLLRGNG